MFLKSKWFIYNLCFLKAVLDCLRSLLCSVLAESAHETLHSKLMSCLLHTVSVLLKVWKYVQTMFCPKHNMTILFHSRLYRAAKALEADADLPWGTPQLLYQWALRLPQRTEEAHMQVRNTAYFILLQKWHWHWFFMCCICSLTVSVRYLQN